MPDPDRIWRHVVPGTRGTWLHGDPRGFRSRDHRIHSSGDYRNPPPPREHANLLQHHRELALPTVIIPAALRAALGVAFITRLQIEKCHPLAVAVSGTHTHILAELPGDPTAAKQIIGRCKGYASYAIRNQLPGAIWAQGGSFQPIRDRAHQINTFHYILEQQGPDAWAWSFRNELSKNPALKGPA